MPVQAISALAVAPSDPNVWAGTEAWALRLGCHRRRRLQIGQAQGGRGDNVGLVENRPLRGSSSIRPIRTSCSCATGRLAGRRRKGHRTTDGGQHWEQVLFVDEARASELVDGRENPRTLVAGTWQVEMHPWAESSGGPGSGVYISHDSGAAWTRVESAGLPKSPLGKIGVAIAPSDSNRVYALIQTKDQGSVWRSDDGGRAWRVVNWSRELIGRAGYYIHLAVSPENEDEVLISNSSFFQSTDGGQTFRSVNWGGDNHDIWWDPKNADRFVITHDAGLTLTTQHGRSTARATADWRVCVAIDRRAK
jgi:photosystem II stability/assembly factor-like uncharacterized protein